MSTAIKKILESSRTESQFHTHVSLISPKGKFQFSREVLELFWSEYCKLVDTTENPMVGIAEKPQPFMPLLSDVDIKVKETDDMDLTQHLYNEKHLTEVIKAYQTVAKDLVKDIKDKHLMCFVLEKNPYRVSTSSGDYIKNGFHLHFPYLFLPRNDIEVQIIPRVKKILETKKVFLDIGIEDSGSVIDKAACKNEWLLYGSKKEETMEAYTLTTIYDHEMVEMDIDEALHNYLIYDSNEKPINISGNEWFYLPRILSIIPFYRQTLELKSNIESLVKSRLKAAMKNKKKTETTFSDAEVSAQLADAKKLLHMIKDHRADNREDWISVMWVLYNISDGNEDGLAMFLDFSQRCEEKYNESDCISAWEKTVKRENGLGMGTLHYFAEIDSPEEYKKWREEKSEKHIAESLISGGGHNDLAKALYELYGNRFVCASVVNSTWYEFQGHRWHEVEDGITLRNKISDALVDKFNTRLKEASNNLAKCEDDAEKAMYNTRIKQMMKIINNCKSAPFKNNIMKECKEVFYKKDFIDRLNKDKYKICCANGVYDLNKHTFRPGLPDDYFSIALPVTYIEFNEADESVQFVQRYFEKVFPDKSVRDYFYHISSDVVVGGNFYKKVFAWSGEGDNAKSVTQTLFEKMLGPYAKKLPTSLITGKRTQSSQAAPELARAEYARWCVLQEPDKKDVMNVGIFKELSGNDTFFCRSLFSQGKEIEPMFKLVLICNDPPAIPYSDKAFWNRMRVIPFESTFCDDAPEDWEEQLRQKRFPVDRNFNDKIPDMLEPLLWILLNHRKKNLPRIEPEKVKFATNALKQKNDCYRQFMDESLIEEEGKFISLTEMYTLFKNWFKESLPAHSVPVKNEFKEYFEKLWGPPGKGAKWRGWRQRTLEDDIEAGDAFILEVN